MPSTVIRDFSYDEARNELTVNFRSSKVYVYTLVPPSVAAAFASAPSPGAFFNETIRDRYGWRQAKVEARREKEPGMSLRDALKASRED
jgi:lysyl-tRNA synthetase class 2